MTSRAALPTGLELPSNYSICLGRCGLEFRQPQRIPFCRRCLDKMTPAIRDNIAELSKQVHRREAWIESWRLHSIRQCLRHLRLIPAIYGLTLKNPWAWAVAHAGKPAEPKEPTEPTCCRAVASCWHPSRSIRVHRCPSVVSLLPPGSAPASLGPSVVKPPAPG